MTITDPTLAGDGTKTFASSTSATLTLHGVQTEIIRKTGNFLDLPKPLNDSDKKLLMDLMGAGREITIDGEVTVGNVALLYNYAQDIVGLGANSLIFGKQGTNSSRKGYVYTPEVLNRGNTGAVVTINVYVSDTSVISDKGNPNSFKYSITLLECSGTGSL